MVDLGRTIGPVERHYFQPLSDPLSEVATAAVLRNAELIDETSVTEERYTLAPFGMEASPRKPHVEIETARIACQCSNHMRVDRYGMRLDLLPECLTEADYVRTRIGSNTEVIRFGIAP
jgi:hypothetical protein